MLSFEVINHLTDHVVELNGLNLQTHPPGIGL